MGPPYTAKPHLTYVGWGFFVGQCGVNDEMTYIWESPNERGLKPLSSTRILDI